jgi:PRTRC genetic system protein A
MSAAVVDYLVARNGAPPRRGLAYDYVVAGDGLYVVAENQHLSARVPVARAIVRGLPPLYPSLTLRAGRLPQGLWNQIAAGASARPGREVLLAVSLEPTGYQVLRPAQLTGPTSVIYRPPRDALLQIHSHGAYPAHFSPTDDADEQGFGLYGVVGGLGSERPEVALRVGVYGYFLSVPWEAVFAGDRGAFRDVGFDGPDEIEGGGGLPH